MGCCCGVNSTPNRRRVHRESQPANVSFLQSEPPHFTSFHQTSPHPTAPHRTAPRSMILSTATPPTTTPTPPRITNVHPTAPHPTPLGAWCRVPVNSGLCRWAPVNSSQKTGLCSCLCRPGRMCDAGHAKGDTDISRGELFSINYPAPREKSV